MPYAIPPWVGQPADPAAHYATGFHTGMQLGAQQAAQMFQRQQLELQQRHQLMAEQQQAFEDQYNAQIMDMKAAEMARKAQAGQEFRYRVGMGEDPQRVLMQLAPDLGESVSGIMAGQQRQAQNQAMMGWRQAQLQRQTDADAERERIAKAQITSREKIAAQRDTFSSKVDKLAKLQEAFDAANASGDPAVIQQAKAELDAARAFVPANRMPSDESELIVKDVPGFGKVAYMKGSRQIHVARQEPTRMAFKSKWLPTLMRDGMTTDKANQLTDEAWDKIAPPAAPGETVPTGKVKVRNPQGKIGFIRSDQLKAALAQGYIQVD